MSASAPAAIAGGAACRGNGHKWHFCADSLEEIPFGTVTVTARLDDHVPERRKIIFDPVPRVDGIESSGDPLTEVRSDLYLQSGRRRKADGL